MDFDIRFRAFKKGDEVFINNLRQIEEMESNLVGSKIFVSIDREAKWVEDIIMGDNKSAMYFAITEKGNNDIIGYATITDIDYRNGNCNWGGIKLSPSVSRKGYGFQATLKLLKFIFEELRIVRFYGVCQENNNVSVNLMLKAGFKKEGLLRKYSFKNGQHINAWLFGITDDEYGLIKKEYNL